MARYASALQIFLVFSVFVEINSKECDSVVPPRFDQLTSRTKIAVDFEAHFHKDIQISFNGISYSNERGSFFLIGEISNDQNVSIAQSTKGATAASVETVKANMYILEVSWGGDLTSVIPLGVGFAAIEALAYTRDNKIVVAERYPTSFTEINLLQAVDEQVVEKGFGSAARAFDIAVPISSVPDFGIQGLAYAPEYDVLLVATARAYPRIFAVRLETGELEQLFRVHHLSATIEGLSVTSLTGLDYESMIVDGGFLAVSDSVNGVNVMSNSDPKHLIRIGTDMQLDKLAIIEHLGIGEGTFADLSGLVKGVVNVDVVPDTSDSGPNRYGIGLVSSDSKDIIVLHGAYTCGVGVQSEPRFGGVCPRCVHFGIFCYICSIGGPSKSDPNPYESNQVEGREHISWLFLLLLLIPLAVFFWRFIRRYIMKSRNDDDEDIEYPTQKIVPIEQAEVAKYSSQVKLLSQT